MMVLDNTGAAPLPDPANLGSPRHGTPRLGTPTIDHLGIAVQSIAAARGFYESLGLTVAHEEDVEHEGVRTAMLPIGESRIELIEPLSANSPVGKFLSKRGEGLHHIAFHVDDITATLAHMRANGVEIASPEVQVGAGGHLYFFVHPRSAGGVLIEICQDLPPGQSPSPEWASATPGQHV